MTVSGILLLLDLAFDEQVAVVIAPGAAEEDEVMVAVDIIGDAKPRLELAIERFPVIAVRDVILGIDSAAGQPW